MSIMTVDDVHKKWKAFKSHKLSAAGQGSYSTFKSIAINYLNKRYNYN